MKLALAFVVAALLAAGAGPAWSQAEPAVAAAPDAVGVIASEAPATIRIPAGTEVVVELTEALSSRTSQQEQLFGLRLAEPVVVAGLEVVAVGAPGGGEVIDAHRSAFGGRQGRLIISGRYIEIGGQRVRIRGMQITAAGEQRTTTALAVSMIPYAGVAGIFVQGGEIEIPVGARGTARLAVDVDVPIVVNADVAPTQPSQQGENQQ
jgi:hypothetical protein